jgi:hypothetical protein
MSHDLEQPHSALGFSNPSRIRPPEHTGCGYERELEVLFHKQIADVTGLLLDTVISSLSSASERPRQSLAGLARSALQQETRVIEQVQS